MPAAQWTKIFPECIYLSISSKNSLKNLEIFYDLASNKGYTICLT